MNVQEQHIDSWKNATNEFTTQLESNLKELDNYPDHWVVFVNYIKKLSNEGHNPQSILDIGCGCGTYYEICRQNSLELKYTGMDYAQAAIELAKEHWNYNNFYIKDYKDLTKEIVAEHDILHACSLHNVLPNADEALEFFLQLDAKIIILGKLLTCNGPSNSHVYNAYGSIITYLYHHNYENVLKLFKKYNYDAYGDKNMLPNNFLLIKK